MSTWTGYTFPFNEDSTGPLVEATVLSYKRVKVYWNAYEDEYEMSIVVKGLGVMRLVCEALFKTAVFNGKDLCSDYEDVADCPEMVKPELFLHEDKAVSYGIMSCLFAWAFEKRGNNDMYDFIEEVYDLPDNGDAQWYCATFIEMLPSILDEILADACDNKAEVIAAVVKAIDREIGGYTVEYAIDDAKSDYHDDDMY